MASAIWIFFQINVIIFSIKAHPYSCNLITQSKFSNKAEFTYLSDFPLSFCSYHIAFSGKAKPQTQ